jgi:site-specific recombinase XerD
MSQLQGAPDRVRVSGPLARFADGFRVDLIERGYSLWGAQEQIYLLAHVSRWMEVEGLQLAALTPAMVDEYIVWRRGQGYLSGLSPKSLRRVFGYLDGLGVLRREDAAPSPVERLVGEFRGYLLVERGMAAGSVRLYERIARLFLEERSERLEDDLASLSGAEINVFVLREARRRSYWSALTVVSALRALLRFLHVQGLIAEPLAAAVPSVARRREDLPSGLAPDQVQQLLDSCDRSTPVGRRDYAILLLLSRLGLRGGEVAGLELDDVDWRAGEVVIRGKGSRVDLLPLPDDLGEALVDYLRHGRRRGFGRAVFLTVCAPLTGVSRGAVSDIVVRACERAGVPPVRCHCLRHTVASELLSRGAGLAEIGQVLRHRDLRTTAVYAKVDRQALSGLALPWPGGER